MVRYLLITIIGILSGCQIQFEPILTAPTEAFKIDQFTGDSESKIQLTGYYQRLGDVEYFDNGNVMWLFENGVIRFDQDTGSKDSKDSIEFYLYPRAQSEDLTESMRRSPNAWGIWQPSGDSLIVYTHKLGGGGRVPTSTAVAWGGQVQGDTIILSRMEGKRKKAIRIEEKWIFHPSDWKPDSVNYVIRNSE